MRLDANQVQKQVGGICPKIQTSLGLVRGLVIGTKFHSLRLDFVAKMACSDDGTCRRDRDFCCRDQAQGLPYPLRQLATFDFRFLL